MQLEPPADALPALADAEAMRLIVIDYAETRIAQLVSLLPSLWARATRLHPVRVVLLVRTRLAGAPDWRSSLTATGDANLGNLLDEADVFEIETTGFDDRVKMYHQAVAGFVNRRVDRDGTSPQTAAGTVFTPDLSPPVFDNPLMVVIAAYLAVHHDAESAIPPPRSRPELLDELLSHEARFWNRQWSEAGLAAGDATLQAQVVALATLAGARDEDDAVTLLTLLPDLATEPSGRIRAIARWAHQLYADIGSTWWNTLQPDVLGEHLVATRMGTIPSVLAGVLDRDDPPVLTRALNLLARTVPDHANLEPVLRPLLSSRLIRLCHLAIQQAANIRSGWRSVATNTLAGALTRTLLVTRIRHQIALRDAAKLLPIQYNLVLANLALVLDEQRVALYRELAAANLATHESDLASSLHSLSLRLVDVGRLAEALTVIEEAVTIRRRLIQNSPDHRPYLAESLNYLSLRLAGAGRQDEALTVIEEAVSMYRKLAAADPAHEPGLARSLNNLSLRLTNAGDLNQALTVNQEAVDLYRAWADSVPHQPDLARSLHNLSLRLADVGRRDEAAVIIDEAVSMYRKLAEANPAAHQHNLGRLLNNQSDRLAEARRWDEALALSEEAVTMFRELAEVNPAIHEPDLARSLGNLSLRLAGAGRRVEGLAANQEAVTVYRRLAATKPGAQPDLAASLTHLSIRLAEAGQWAEGLAANQEAVTIYRQLAAINPAAKPKLAASLRVLVWLLRGGGDEKGARRAEEEGSALIL